MSHQACFLGAGISTALGTGIEAHLRALKNMPPPANAVTCIANQLRETLPYKLFADIPLASAEQRLHQVINGVINNALTAANIPRSEYAQVALFLGSTSFDVAITEQTYLAAIEKSPHAIAMEKSPSFGKLGENIRHHFGFLSSDFSFNTACTSSANAVWYASRLIAAGHIRYALVLGVEVLNYVTALGFHGLGLLTQKPMKPFDAERDGLILGEAASALVLGAGNAQDFRLLGGANQCDTHSMSAANADGSSIATVIHAAMSDAGVTPENISAIKAHGTASLLNDEAEAAGLLRVFSQQLTQNHMPPICALKPFIGHTLGACGLTELILFWQALVEGFIPATPNIGADSAVLGIALTQKKQAAKNGAFLLNYFGFGGNNTALVMGRGDMDA